MKRLKALWKRYVEGFTQWFLGQGIPKDFVPLPMNQQEFGVIADKLDSLGARKRKKFVDSLPPGVWHTFLSHCDPRPKHVAAAVLTVLFVVASTGLGTHVIQEITAPTVAERAAQYKLVMAQHLGLSVEAYEEYRHGHRTLTPIR